MTFLVLLAARSAWSQTSWAEPAAQPPGTSCALAVEVDDVPVAARDVVAVVALAVRVGRGRAEVAVVAVEVVRAARAPVMVAGHRAGAALDPGAAPRRRRIAVRELGRDAVVVDVVAGGQDVALDALDDVAGRGVFGDRARRDVAAPTNTGSVLAVVWKVQVGPVVVAIPSPTVRTTRTAGRHPGSAQMAVSVVPETTPVCWAIWANLPLANGRPKKVTVSGSASGSDTATLRVGEVPMPLAPLAGALSVGAFGAGCRRSAVTAPGHPGRAAARDGAVRGRSHRVADRPAARLVDPPAAMSVAPELISSPVGADLGRLRATFQIRASSITPAKQPGGRWCRQTGSSPRGQHAGSSPRAAGWPTLTLPPGRRRDTGSRSSRHRSRQRDARRCSR